MGFHLFIVLASIYWASEFCGNKDKVRMFISTGYGDNYSKVRCDDYRDSDIPKFYK